MLLEASVRRALPTKSKVARATLAMLTLPAGLGVAAMVAGTTSPAAAAVAGCSGGKIVIGLDKAETGSFALNDQADTQGVKLAITLANQSGGILGCKLTVVSGDSKSDPAIGGQVAQELIKDGAQILVVPADFDLGIAAAQAAEKAGILGVAPSASSLVFGPAVGPHFFSGAITPDVLGQAAAKFALHRGWKTAYDVTDNSFNYFTSIDQYFVSTFKAGGGTIVGSQLVKSGTQDFSATVSKIAGSKASFVFGNDYFPQVAAFIKQLRQSGVDAPVIGNSAYAFRGLPGAIGSGNTKNVFYATQAYYEGAGVPPGVARFIASFERAYHQFPPSINSLIGYQVMSLVLQAVKTAGSVNAGAVSKALDAQHNVKIAGSTLVSWTNGHAVWAATMVGLTASGGFEAVSQ
jgi:branched-chain amino acid transport system substrate-binding protein